MPRVPVLVAVAVALFAGATAVAARGVHGEPVPCRRVEAAALPGGDPGGFPIVAQPGTVRDLGGAVPGAFRFERDLGAFRMRYELSPEERRWGIGRATLADACACDAGGMGVEIPTPSSNVLLRRAGDVYVLTSSGATPGSEVPFRSVPAGARVVWTGLGPAALWFASLAALATALAGAWRVRRSRARFTAWREGVVGPSGTVLPADGGAAMFAHGPALQSGARVLHAPPCVAAPYRSEPACVEIVPGTRADLAARERAWRRRVLALVVVSMAASAAALALAVASTVDTTQLTIGR